MHWHILGAGSIGCLWATAFIKSGFETTLILSSKERLTEYEERGCITYEEDTHSFEVLPEAELASSEEQISNLLVTTKAFSVEEALASVSHRLAPNSRVVLLHNGLGPQYEIAQQYPGIDLYLATTTDGVYIKSPFHIVRAGRGITYVGKMNHSALLPELLPVQSNYLKIEAVENIEQRLWCKLAINAAINPLTAIFQCRNGELLEKEERLDLMNKVCDEVTLIAKSAGQPLFPNDLIDEVKKVAIATAQNYSSMLQDIRHKRRTEIEQITGFICKNADDLNIETPVNQQLLFQIRNISSVS